MIRSLLKVALLSISASSNAVLTTPKGKYITDDEPAYEDSVELYAYDDFYLYMDSMVHSGNLWDDPYTTMTYSQAICTKTTHNLKSRTIFLTAYEYEQYHDDNELHLIDKAGYQPFYLSFTEFEITQNTNIIYNIYNLESRVWGGTDSQLYEIPLITYKYCYICYDKDLTQYMQTLWDFYNKNQSSMQTDDPFGYKNALINEIKNVSESSVITNTHDYISEGTEILMQSNMYFGGGGLALNNNQKIYVLFYYQLQRANQSTDVIIESPNLDLLQIGYYEDDPTFSYDTEGYLVAPISYEVIDVPDLMFTIVGMPFTFISRAFNLTLFPNTPYAVNIGNIFISLIGVLTFVFVLKVILKLKG